MHNKLLLIFCCILLFAGCKNKKEIKVEVKQEIKEIEKNIDSLDIFIDGTVLVNNTLRHVDVFMDKNKNYLWDKGEASCEVGTSGKYRIKANVSDLQKYPLVAKIKKDITIDTDKAAERLKESYTMVAPPEFPKIISPISTLIYGHTLAKGNTSKDSAEIIRQKLGYNEKFNILQDYALNGASYGAFSLDYSKLQNIAIGLAALLGHTNSLYETEGFEVKRYEELIKSLAITPEPLVIFDSYDFFETKEFNEIKEQAFKYVSKIPRSTNKVSAKPN